MWRKSSYSGTGSQSDCVELARLSHDVGIRDSKNPDAGHLTISSDAFAELLGRIRAHRLDL